MPDTPNPSFPSIGRRRGPLLALSAGLLVIGVALVAMMVVTEGEPGALPLVLVVLGLTGGVVARVQNRAPRR